MKITYLHQYFHTPNVPGSTRSYEMARRFVAAGHEVDLITADPKVTAIFVNIFGGIVRCDDIAKGLISVAETMNLRIPIIARLQGTNMEAAQKLIDESGLKIFSINDLQSAAEKSVQFSKIVKTARDIDVGVEFNLGI